MHWQTTRFRIDLAQPRVMGIVNVTPDSFSDGGRYAQASAAIDGCVKLVEEGADLLDIGGESTRPGAQALPDGEELARVLPVLRGALDLGVPISVDTSSTAVIQEALAMGVDIINDVRSLRGAGALESLAAHPAAGICLMHMRGEPNTMTGLTGYEDVVEDVAAFLRARALTLEAAGIAHERIVVDPGIGFAKTPAHNLLLLSRQRELTRLGWPLLVGWSRKGTIGLITGRPAGERVVGSVAAAMLAVQRGAAIVRVHDVAATVDALRVWQAVEQGLGEGR
jgi:dihydropteroate synthase